jgi:arylsulfatase A-like enzyme
MRVRTTALLAVIAMCGSCFAASKPNIIVIVADDLGYADVGCQGQSKDVKTPNIDTIAANGVRCTNGYVSCPVCSPTRAGLMTGRYQQRFGHEFNPGPAASADFGLPLDQITLPQTLKARGYATGMVGKWHLGFKPEMHPQQRGFDEFFGFLAGAHVYNDVGTGKNALMRGITPLESTDYLTDAFGREACAFIDRHAGGEKPFFFYLPFNAIHSPQQAPKKYLDRFPDEKDEKRHNMLAMLSALDDNVGNVLAKVREKKIEENTLIFFISDNGGPTMGNGSRNTPFSGFKGEVKEGGFHEPFMVQWKGTIPAGKTYDKPIIQLDIFPTCLAVAGADTPEGVKFDGVNILPFITGKDDGMPHQALFWRFGNAWAVRDGDMKLRHARDDASVKLFDLAADPGEKNDLAASKPEVAKKLQAEFDQWNSELAKPRWQDSRVGRRERRDGPAAAKAEDE